MNVEEYFPEGLSVIHPDESHREKRGTREVLQTTFSPPIHCHICYKSIVGTVNNVDYIKPCNCQIMFVHTRCASRNKLKFGQAKCSNCGQGSTIPRAPKMYSCRKVGSVSGKILAEKQNCSACHHKDFDGKKGERGKSLEKKIQPCFCGRVYHLGCLTSLLQDRSSCSECSVLYHAFEPASLKQFLKSNWIYYVTYIFVLAFFSTLFVISLKNSVLMKPGDYSSRTKVLTGTAAFFLVIIIAFLVCVLKYTWCSAIPTFRITHGKVFLKPYKRSNTWKTQKKVLETLQEDEFEEIPLNELKKNIDENVVETEESCAVEDARGCEAEDMTLGQHMFGVYATHHSSSTPIDRPPLGFVFNSA